jgi:hypothetical protein
LLAAIHRAEPALADPLADDELADRAPAQLVALHEAMIAIALVGLDVTRLSPETCLGDTSVRS